MLSYRYRGAEPTDSEFGFSEIKTLDVTNQIGIAHFIGYLSSWSAYNLHRTENPGLEDPLITFKREVMEALGAQDESTVISMTTRFCLLLARDPVKGDQKLL